ncbi:MAG: OmpA family protein [Deltaproteobacteria bacterium]|nr:OmpA family protein [Deltaproteobacteria bacterium]
MACPLRKRGRGFPAVVLGLLAGALVLLFPSFSPAAPPGTQIQNVASLVAPPAVPLPGISSNQTTVTVDNVVAVAISPPGSAVVYPGTTVSYRHTVTNMGNVSEVMDVEATSSLGYSYAFYAADGVTPLPDSNGNGRPDVGSLPPGGSVDIVIKVVVPATALIGQVDVTTVRAVPASAPSAQSSVSNRSTVADIWDPLSKTVEPSGQVTPGFVLRYTNAFGNAGTVPVMNVVITDNLDAHLLYVEGSATLPQGVAGATVVYDPGTRTITWRIPTVPPGYRGQMGFLATVDPATASDTTIPNVIAVTSDQTPVAKISNLVTSVVVEQPLRISKAGSRAEAEIGDSVLYIVRVENSSATSTADNVVITDILPFGFRYVKGSSVLDNAAIPDPTGGTRPAWAIGAMAPGAVRTLRYRAVLSLDAPRGNGTNSASVNGRSPGGNSLASGPARYRVKVLEGVLGSRGIVLGRVFLDRNGDRMPGEDEPGFGGVRVYLEDGTFAETDKEGKYSIYGIRPGEHVLKLDRSSLPPGLVPVPLDSTFAGDGGSRFVSLPFGGNARGDFALLPSPSFDNDCLPGGAGSTKNKERVMIFGTEPSAAPPPSLEVQIQYMPQTPEILEPANGATLSRAYSDIAVRVPEGVSDTVRVNGAAVPRKLIGKKIHESAKKIHIYRYVGVTLVPGPNTIALETQGPGGEVSVKSIAVTVPGPPSWVRLTPSMADIGADGKTPVPFTATLLDVFGKPSFQEQIVTVVLARGKVIEPDLDPATPGHQIKAVDGRATFSVRGGGETGPETLKVLAGTSLAASAELFFVPTSRPWVVAGIADVTAGANKVSGETGNATETELFKDGFAHKERLAVFAKGSVGNGYLVTGSYDTGKEKTDPLFQQVDPARDYPMYTDASRIGYDAASGDKLFLKVEKDRSYALYGDYRTDLTQTDFARYDRVFTGAKADVDTGRVTLRAFGAESGQVLVRDEIKGNGTSGFYFLTRRPIVENSERVRIEVRDRYHLERILSTVEKVGYTDYTIDYAAGSILFKEPVPSFDAGMNPVLIVALYESTGTGGEFYTYGGRAAVRPWKGFEVGATAVREDRNLDRATLSGVDATLRLGKSSLVKAEAAETDTTVKGKGTAWKVEAEGAPTEKTKVAAYYRDVGKEFENLSAQSAEPGTVKYGAKADYRPTPSTGFTADGYVQENTTVDSKLTSLTGSVAHKRDRITTEGGYQFLRDEKGAPGEAGTDSQLAYASVTDRFTDRVTGTLKHTQLLSSKGVDQYQTETAAGLEYRITDATKAVVTENFQWTGEKRQATLFGLESRLAKSTVFTSRYEIENAASGQRMQSLIGLNHQYSPRKDLKLDMRAEWIDYLKGANEAAEGIALALAAEYLPRKDVKVTGRTEFRLGKEETTTLFSLGAGMRLTPDFGILGRVNLWNARRDQGGAATYDALAGVAYRPKGVRSVYLLDTVRFVLERNEGVGITVESKRLVTSNEVSWRVDPRLTLMGKYAGKYAWEVFEGKAFGMYTDLAIAGATYDLTDRWDVGAQARLMNQYAMGAHELSAVVRAGYRIVKNLYAGAGYNFARLNDQDLSGAGWQSHGPFIELKVKFDEATLHLPGWNDAPKPPPCPPPPAPVAFVPPPAADNIVPGSRRIERPIEVVGSVEMPALLVNGSEVPLPSGDAVLHGHLPDGSLQFEGNAFSKPVQFEVGLAPTGTPSAWNVSVLDAGGAPIRALAGAGAPPPAISWDGRSEDGRTVDGGAVYRYQMKVSYADNSVSTGGIRDFAVNRSSAISMNLTGSAFEFNSAVLSAKARKALKEMAAILRKYPEEKVTVEGHTDSVGTDAYNMALSRRRAESAAEFLVKECGIPSDRFTVGWYGESRPIASNDTPAGRELNRRVELKGEFRKTQRAAVYDRYRTTPIARINGTALDVDPLGRFRTELPPGTERIGVELLSADGRSVRTSLPVPGIRIETSSEPVRIPTGAATDRLRFSITGWTEPGNALDRDGNPVPLRPDGGFADTVELRPGGNLFGFTARNPAGVTRILHVDLDVSGERGKGATAQ